MINSAASAASCVTRLFSAHVGELLAGAGVCGESLLSSVGPSKVTVGFVSQQAMCEGKGSRGWPGLTIAHITVTSVSLFRISYLPVREAGDRVWL